MSPASAPESTALSGHTYARKTLRNSHNLSETLSSDEGTVMDDHKENRDFSPAQVLKGNLCMHIGIVFGRVYRCTPETLAYVLNAGVS